MNNVGFKLDYVEPANIGEKLLMEIEDDDIESGVEFWKNVVVYYVLDAHPLFNILNGFIPIEWGKLSISKVVLMKNDILFVIFNTIQGNDKVINKGIYYFDNKSLFMKP
ncbi:hypothetical protein BC332_24030 [Capsicum chinense]|nr:hypothetical protein BC332_24030 [Capsicum chinense]